MPEIGVINRANRQDNTGLETFEQHTVPYLLEDDRFEAVDYIFRKKVRAITSEISAGFKAMRQARLRDYDALFVPSHTLMMAVNPMRVPCPVVPYIHDTFVLTTTSYGHAFRYKGKLWEGNVKRCGQVIAASQLTRTDLRERIAYKGDTEVIYQGTGMDAPEVVPNYDERDIDILYVGEFRDRKNPELVKNVAKQAKRNGLKMVLVNRERLDVDCRQFINLSDEALQEVYQRSRFYLHPSLIEGFGRTPVEAQINGCNIIGLDTAINEEIIDGFHTVQDATDVIEVVSGIEKENWEACSEAGRSNAERFDFGRTREQIKSLLLEVAENGC